jgi:hypothetical protein
MNAEKNLNIGPIQITESTWPWREEICNLQEIVGQIQDNVYTSNTQTLESINLIRKRKLGYFPHNFLPRPSTEEFIGRFLSTLDESVKQNGLLEERPGSMRFGIFIYDRVVPNIITPRELRILNYKYGLNGKKKTQTEIARGEGFTSNYTAFPHLEGRLVRSMYPVIKGQWELEGNSELLINKQYNVGDTTAGTRLIASASPERS